MDDCAAELRDGVRAALEVLDVQRRVDVDAVVEQFDDVEVSLGVAASGGVGVGEFVHQGERGLAGEHGVDVQLLERRPAVVDGLPRE